MYALEENISELESYDPRFAKRLPGSEPVRTALSVVLRSIPEEETVEDLVVLVACADLQGVEAELGEQVARTPGDVAAFQGVGVVVDLVPVGRGRVDTAAREREDAADATLERAVPPGIVERIQTDLVGRLEPLVSLVHGSGGPPTTEAGVALCKSHQLYVERGPQRHGSEARLPEAERRRKPDVGIGRRSTDLSNDESERARADA